MKENSKWSTRKGHKLEGDESEKDEINGRLLKLDIRHDAQDRHSFTIERKHICAP